MRPMVVWVAIGCVGPLLMPMSVSAQTLGANISGLVQDSTGAVLPGVTVEASSTALIEKVRSAVTDDTGRYTIINLRPGTYEVTFSLTGFRSVRRPNIVLQGAATVQVNVELGIGSLEETLTVTGQTAVVDVQNTRGQFVANREVLDSIPAGRSFAARAVLIPGVVAPQGTASLGGGGITVHGSAAGEAYTYNDGYRAGAHLQWTGTTWGGWDLNDAATAELTYDLSAQSAEMQVSGIRMNAVPKEGGNVFSGTWITYGAWGGVQSDNRTPELKPVISQPNQLAHSVDINPAFGGPIWQNTLWFFSSGRMQRDKTYQADTYFPDGQPAYQYPRHDSGLLRLTYQMTRRDRFGFSADKRSTMLQYATVGRGTQPSAGPDISVPGYQLQSKWTSTVSNRMMLQAGGGINPTNFTWHYQSDVGPFDVPRRELSTGRFWGAAPLRNDYRSNRRTVWAAATYVTGSHNLKTGFTHMWGWQKDHHYENGDIQTLNFLNGQPTSMIVLNTPLETHEKLKADLGLYVQDQSTLKRFTFNLGARYDHFNAEIPEQTAPAGRFVPARLFAGIKNVPNWNDWSVRLGVAYDLFGTGKTALKAHVGKYIEGQALGFTQPFNPMTLQSNLIGSFAVGSEVRSWQDLDGNGSALDAQGNVQYAEVGPSRNAKFGLAGGTARPAPGIPRAYNWEQNAVFQHELHRGVSLTAGYYRRQYHNLRWTDNVLVDPDQDYTPFTITTPRDSRLPNGGGEVITRYNLNPTKLGVVDNVISVSTRNRQAYNGFELAVDARLVNGVKFLGSVTTERMETDLCEVDDPNARRFCHVDPPFRTLYKAAGTYSFPYDIQVSGTWQLVPGASFGALYSVNSAIAGVSLTGGGTLGVQLIEPSTLFYDYRKQVDVRVLRTFRLRRVRAQALVDIFNIFNESTVTALNQNYGGSWLRPQAILNGRYLRFGTQVEF